MREQGEGEGMTKTRDGRNQQCLNSIVTHGSILLAYLVGVAETTPTDRRHIL